MIKTFLEVKKLEVTVDQSIEIAKPINISAVGRESMITEWTLSVILNNEVETQLQTQYKLPLMQSYWKLNKSTPDSEIGPSRLFH